MNRAKSIVIVAALAIPAGLIWCEAKRQTASTPAAPFSAPPAMVSAPAPVTAAAPVPVPRLSPVVDTVGSDGVLKHIAQPVDQLPVQPVVQAPATVTDAPAASLKYTAASGDTVEKLAGAFLGNGDQAHQDTITDANPSLQNNPDRLIAGKTYRIPAPTGLAATPSRRPSTQPDSDQVIAESTPRILKYTAAAGDNVTTLAVKLLGSDTQEARNTIINSNPSLKRDPDRLIAGQTYSIPAPLPSVTP